jgi:formylglycine-generating enzyme required for sulfatase activity
MGVLNELEGVWKRSDAVFALLKDDVGLYARPIPLRHPPIFYVGHLAAFAWNHLGAGVLGLGRVDERLDVLFARGIDPQDEDAAESVSVEADQWPTAGETRAYRDRVRAAVREAIPQLQDHRGDVLADQDRVVHLIIEHEQMHHETLIYLLKRMPLDRLVSDGSGICGDDCAEATIDPHAAPERLAVPGGDATIGGSFEALDFGWDNEFPACCRCVAGFTLDALPVTIGRYRAFVQETGADAPIDWFEDEGWKLRTLLGVMDLDEAAGLPVHVTQRQARAFAEHNGGRLPSEAELTRAAYGDGLPQPWGTDDRADRGNFGWRRLGSSPVGAYPEGAGPYGHQELVGNGWEWTSTPFAPLPGFNAWVRTYPGYSTDFFDGDHYVVFGGAWPTADRLLRRSFRNWYFEDYPHAFTTFRVAY